MHERLPVLEDVAPVALVIQNLGAVDLAVGIDREFIPGPAGIAVSAAEFKRQILLAQAVQIGVITAVQQFCKIVKIEGFVQ